MKCEYCGAEIPEDSAVCPDCGRLLRENSGEKGYGVKRITALVVVVVLSIALIIALAFAKPGMQNTNGSTATNTSQDTTQPTVAPDGDPGTVTCKGSYTVSDEQILILRDREIAWVGDKALTNTQLQVYYWMQYYYFIDSYGAYIPYLGLDLQVPLDMQVNQTEGGITWQQFFLKNAIDNWHLYTLLYEKAEAENFQASPELENYMSNLRSNMDKTASDNGFADVETMIKVDMGSGCGFEEYENYLRAYYVGSEYFGAVYDNMTVTEEEMKEYFKENKETLKASGITEDTRAVDVRHILVVPEGEAGADGTYSDEAWEACRVKAQQLLDDWLAGKASEESFGDMARQHTEDPGSKSTGGLYSGVLTGQMVEEFENWCFDESRQPGDYGLVRTRYGYHVMYFSRGYLAWRDQAEKGVRSQKAREYLEEVRAETPIRVDYSGIALALPQETE